MTLPLLKRAHIDLGGSVASLSTPRQNYAGAVAPTVPVVSGGIVSDPAQISGTVTNLITYSQDLSHAGWSTYNAGGPALPTVTGAAALAPNGLSQATQINFPAVSGVGAVSMVYQNITLSTPVIISVWMRTVSGTGHVYLAGTTSGSTYDSVQCNLTTTWQRFSVVTTTSRNAVQIDGADLRDATQSANSAVSIYAWGFQVESITGFGNSPGPYVATGAASAAGVRGAVTNNLLYSEAMVSGSSPVAPWTKNSATEAAVTLSTVSAANPLGATVNVARAQIPATTVGGGGDYTQFFQTFTAVATTYRWSVWLKSGSGSANNCMVRLYDTSTHGMVDCAVTTSWQRFTGSAALTAGANRGFLIGNADIAHAASDVLIWGAMVEPVDFGAASTYVPTTTAISSIASDCSVLFPCIMDDPKNWGVGVKVSFPTWAVTDNIINIGQTPAGNSLNSAFIRVTSIGYIYFYTYDTSGNYMALAYNFTSFPAGSTHTIAVGAENGVMALMVDGARVGTLSGTGLGLSSFPANLDTGNNIAPVAKTIQKLVQARSVTEAARMVG